MTPARAVAIPSEAELIEIENALIGAVRLGSLAEDIAKLRSDASDLEDRANQIVARLDKLGELPMEGLRRLIELARQQGANS